MTALKTVHLGSFDAEAFWRDPELASLPALPDQAGRRIVNAMDELLFLGCKAGDLLLTRFPMQAAFVDYLGQIGFAFEHNADPLDSETIQERQTSIFDILVNSSPEACELLAGVSLIAPYAIVPGTQEFCHKYSIPFDGPSLAAVVKANSKAISHQMAVDLGLKNFGCLVGSSSELVEQGMRTLADGPLIIKDLFGVSGKGSLVVQSESMLKRIGAHLAAQEKKGKRVSLLIEPFLAMKLDFSCQIRIEPAGQVQFLGLQQMHNHQLAYHGSSRLDAEQAEMLEQVGYFRQMEELAAYLDQKAGPLRKLGIRVNTVVQFGNPAERIVSQAREPGTDLIAMATHGRSGLRTVIFGSVAGRVLYSGIRPVLLVRPGRLDDEVEAFWPADPADDEATSG